MKARSLARSPPACTLPCLPCPPCQVALTEALDMVHDMAKKDMVIHF